MLDGFLRSGRGRTSRAVWVPPGGGGGALSTGPGVNEPVGMVQVFSQPFTSMPPTLPALDAHGFTVNSGQERLAIMTDGVDSWLRGTIPADFCHVGSSVWHLLIEGDDQGVVLGTNVAPPAVKWPTNTGQFYSRQWIRFSPNYRMDGTGAGGNGNKAWSPRHNRAAATNNFVIWNRGMAGNPPGDQKAVAPVGQEQTMSYGWLTQTGGVVGSVSYEQSGATWGTSDKRYQSNNGQWHEFEFLLVPGTSGGTDWTLNFWVDGLLVWQRTIVVNNVGDSPHIGEINVFHQYQTRAGAVCNLLNSTDGTGDDGKGFEDQWVDYGYWYGSVEPV